MLFDTNILPYGSSAKRLDFLHAPVDVFSSYRLVSFQ